MLSAAHLDFATQLSVTRLFPHRKFLSWAFSHFLQSWTRSFSKRTEVCFPHFQMMDTHPECHLGVRCLPCHCHRLATPWFSRLAERCAKSSISASASTCSLEALENLVTALTLHSKTQNVLRAPAFALNFSRSSVDTILSKRTDALQPRLACAAPDARMSEF